MANASGPQDMLVFTLTRRGRGDHNYRTSPCRRTSRPGVRPEAFAASSHLFPEGRGRADSGVSRVRLGVDAFPRHVRPVHRARLDARGASAPGATWVEGLNPVVLTRLHVATTAGIPKIFCQETANERTGRPAMSSTIPIAGRTSARDDRVSKTVWERRESEARNYCDLTGATSKPRVEDGRGRSGGIWETVQWWSGSGRDEQRHSGTRLGRRARSLSR
jgi:hypothetical protein